MADIFSTLVSSLTAWGFYGFVLPFLLVFALVYALLTKSKVLGESKGPVGVVSLVLAFFVTAYSGIGAYFVGLTGIAAMLLGALLVVVLFFAMLDFKTNIFSNIWTIAILAVLALLVFSLMGGATISNIVLTEEAWAVIFMLIVIGLAMWFVMCGEICGGQSAGQK